MIPEGFSDWVIIDEIQKIPPLLDEVHRLIEKKKTQVHSDRIERSETPPRGRQLARWKGTDPQDVPTYRRRTEE